MLVPMIRTVILYTLILVSLRILGKRQISQLQTSELVVTLLLSELAVLPIQEEEDSLLIGIGPMIVLVIFELAMAWLMMKSNRFRDLICGKPVVIIKKGEIDQKSMKRLRMTTEDLTEQMRQNNASYLDEVDYAVIETNGMMSIIKRAEDDYITPKQAGVKVESKGIEVVVVSDGSLSKTSIKLCEKTEEWVLDRIKEAHLTLKDVFIMTADTKGKYKIIKKEI